MLLDRAADLPLLSIVVTMRWISFSWAWLDVATPAITAALSPNRTVMRLIMFFMVLPLRLLAEAV
jgi:hypothetical protein